MQWNLLNFHNYKHLAIIRTWVFILYFIPECIVINGIYVWRCTKGFRFKTLIAQLYKFILEPAVFDQFSVYPSICQVHQLWPIFCYLEALECSHPWCGYTDPSTLIGNVTFHQVRAIHSWVYHFWMSPEWNTEFRLTMRDQKESHPSLPV